MIVSGLHTSAEVFTDNIEEAALQWIKEQCDHPAFEGVRIVQMPMYTQETRATSVRLTK